MIEHKPADQPLGDEAFVTLALRYLDGLTSPDEELGFSDQLEAFPHRRDQFVALCRHAGMLRETFTSQMHENGLEASSSLRNASPSLPSVIIQTLPSPLSPLPSFFGGMLFSYLVAAVVLGVALLLASVWKLSDHVQITSHDTSPAPLRALLTPDSSIIAHITGMVDCEWEGSGFRVPGRGATNHKSEIVNQKSVLRLGDRLALRSGLLELTYDTGAKVILQGPATYEVESPAGGYLAVGKLTAKLEKKSNVRGQTSESANQKSEIINHKSFAIRTPTALVTDLGTEFGVQVDRSGSTATHVFQGIVEVQQTSSGNGTSPSVRLGGNQSVQIIASTGKRPAQLRQGTADPSQFVRADQLAGRIQEQRLKPFRRWQAYSQKLRKDPSLVAYYPFEKTETSGKDLAILPNVSGADDELDGQIDGAEWVHGRWPEKSALYFHGAGSNNCVVLRAPQRLNFGDSFSIAVWFRAFPFKEGVIPTLVAKGKATWRLQRYGVKTQGLTFDTNEGEYVSPPPRRDVTDRRWHLVVAMVEPHGPGCWNRIYVDGRLDSEFQVTELLNQSDEPVWIGMNRSRPNRDFHGMIDEVAMFSRALSQSEIAAMFAAGDPDGPGSVEKVNH